ncbi:MAG: pantoate--beta-alanine ligase [Candidatus Synoicihabitans palmerolidicus]|nr:pantoate--beta-alanine ligase [Candidatus Synoicihabitans palmerolidicus]
MQTLTSVSEMQTLGRDWRLARRTVALVPTMGALHEGHLDLVRLAAQHSEIVVVSIFVNPTQFGPNEDYARYPRDLEGDIAKCEAAGAHFVFTPTKDQLFPADYSTYIIEEAVAKPLEGISRPAHFRGVTTVVAKLFNIVQPNLAIFGQKDAQQVAVIRKMVTDLHLPVEIVAATTTRDTDGLALSSRNAYLSTLQRSSALAIPQTLQVIKTMVDKGERRAERLKAEATHLLADRRQIRVIYVSVVDPATMQTQREITPGNSLMAIAAWVEETRLIDNILL